MTRHRTARFAVVLCAAIVTLTLALAVRAPGHCQIPCGIYDDPVRFTLMREHVQTIEKSMNSVIELSKAPGENANQLTRWVMNKEGHADKLATIVTEYFLQQRIAPVSDGAGDGRAAYLHQIELCHRILVRAMKAKQTTDLEHVRELRRLIAEFREAYFGKAEADAQESHDHEHGANHGHSH